MNAFDILKEKNWSSRSIVIGYWWRICTVKVILVEIIMAQAIFFPTKFMILENYRDTIRNIVFFFFFFFFFCWFLPSPDPTYGISLGMLLLLESSPF